MLLCVYVFRIREEINLVLRVLYYPKFTLTLLQTVYRSNFSFREKSLYVLSISHSLVSIIINLPTFVNH